MLPKLPEQQKKSLTILFYVRLQNHVKVKFTLEQATKAQRAIDSQRHAPADLLPGKTRYPL
jgi:hypothetical protein